MTINIWSSGGISKLFEARANPWAPKFEPAPWHDRIEGVYESILKNYAGLLSPVMERLGRDISKPGHVALILNTYNDDNLKNLANSSLHNVSKMRRDLMFFLDSTLLSTNCYAYALNLRKGFKPGALLTPGYLSQADQDCTHPIKDDLPSLFTALAKDGFIFFQGHPDRDKVPETYYLAALLTCHLDGSDKVKDFHFVRYDKNGGCSHKIGHSRVVTVDYKNHRVIDPTQQEIQPGYKYQGCILVPSVLPQHKLC